MTGTDWLEQRMRARHNGRYIGARSRPTIVVWSW
jgi:hypothetical protein